MFSKYSTVDPHTGKKKINWVRVLFIITAVTVPIVHFCVNYVYVNINSFILAFQHQVGGEISFGLSNFEQFLADIRNPESVFSIALINTTKSFLIGLIMYCVGFLVSFFIYKKILFHNIFRIIFYLPSLVSGTVIVAIFKNFVGSQSIVAEIVKIIYGFDKATNLLSMPEFANKVIFAHMIIFAFPLNMIIWGGTFSRIPDSIIEAGKLDGVNWVQEIFYLTIPLVWPTFALTLLLRFCAFFGAEGSVFLFTRGNFDTTTIATWMYLQVVDYHNDINSIAYLSAVGMVLTVIAVTVSLIIRSFTNRVFSDIQY